MAVDSASACLLHPPPLVDSARVRPTRAFFCAVFGSGSLPTADDRQSGGCSGTHAWQPAGLVGWPASTSCPPVGADRVLGSDEPAGSSGWRGTCQASRSAPGFLTPHRSLRYHRGLFGPTPTGLGVLVPSAALTEEAPGCAPIEARLAGCPNEERPLSDHENVFCQTPRSQARLVRC